jgi:hypothetical protein
MGCESIFWISAKSRTKRSRDKWTWQDLEWEEYNEPYKLEELEYGIMRRIIYRTGWDTLPDFERIIAARKRNF